MADTTFPSHTGIEPIEESKPVVALKMHTPAMDAPFMWDEEGSEDTE